MVHWFGLVGRYTIKIAHSFGYRQLGAELVIGSSRIGAGAS